MKKVYINFPKLTDKEIIKLITICNEVLTERKGKKNERT